MNKALVHKLLSLFAKGTCKTGDPALDTMLTGLAHSTSDGRWVVSQRLLQIRSLLSTDGEAVAAVLATQPEIRTPWAGIVAARCQEAAQLSDPNALVQLVTRLQDAAPWVEQNLPGATLKATGQAALERELFPVSAEQAQATPILVRVLAAASRLVRWQQESLPVLNPVNRQGIKPVQNWCHGRLIDHPQSDSGDPDYILSGRWHSQDDPDSMPWVLSTPWAFLLAVIGYVQDSWLAEARGGLLLELPVGQHLHQPSEIQVLVADAQGNEVLCGSLGSFVLKILSRLNMGLFPCALSEPDVNRLLAPLIGELLLRKVWRYQEGLSGEQGCYQIHPDFSDACYQIAGARSFGVYGRELRQAIREQAEQWRIDRQQHIQAKGVAACMG